MVLTAPGSACLRRLERTAESRPRVGRNFGRCRSWATSPSEDLFPRGDGGVRVVAEDPVNAEPVEQRELTRQVARRGEVERVRRIAQPELLGQEGVLAAERPRMKDEAHPVRVANEARGWQQGMGRVARDEQVRGRAQPALVGGG